MSTQLSTEKYLAEIQNDEEIQCANRMAEAAIPKPSTATWAKGLTAICIFFLLIGTLATISGGYGAYHLVKEQGGEQTSARPASRHARRATPDEKQAARIRKMREDAETEHFWLLLSTEATKIAIGTGFLVCVVLLVLRHRTARILSIGICAVALFYHVSSMGVAFLLASKTSGAVHEMFDAAWNDAARQSSLSKEEQQQAKETVGNAFAFGMTIGIAIVFLMRILFYGSVMAYFFQNDIKPIFGEDAMAYLKKQGPSGAAVA